MAKKEEWREIEGYEDYEVSNYGNVRSFISNKILSPAIRHGYEVVNLKGKVMPVHRLVAVAFVDNPDNKPFIDHIDRDRTNNHISNLRFCTQQENNINKSKQSNNKSGYVGIYLRKDTKRYHAQIALNKKKIHIGYFKTLEEATEARKKKEAELFGEFAPN